MHSVAPPVAKVPWGQVAQSLARSFKFESFALNLPLGHWPQTPFDLVVDMPLHARQADGASARPSDPLGQRYRLPHASELVPKRHAGLAPSTEPGPESPQHL